MKELVVVLHGHSIAVPYNDDDANLMIAFNCFKQHLGQVNNLILSLGTVSFQSCCMQGVYIREKSTEDVERRRYWKAYRKVAEKQLREMNEADKWKNIEEEDDE